MQRGPFAFRHLTEFADVGKIVQDGAEVLGASIMMSPGFKLASHPSSMTSTI